ncbi:MAG: hypothetical protein ORN57_01945, partial [Alphaproteobacteria bacterium]|nr:hypothetical protein [Alphaproteobacteria bacterium]
MIDIILLALIAGVLIVRFVMVLGERRDDDPTPPVSMLDVIKKQQKEAPALGAGRGQVDVAPVSEEPMPLGFRLKNKNKKSIDEHKGDQEDKR